MAAARHPLHARLRKRRRGAVGQRGDVDEPSGKVQGTGHALDRALDRDGSVGDGRLRAPRDRAAAAAFGRAAWTVTGALPDRLTPDGPDA